MDKLLWNVEIAFSDPLYVDTVIKSVFERRYGRSSTSKKLQSSETTYLHTLGRMGNTTAGSYGNRGEKRSPQKQFSHCIREMRTAQYEIFSRFNLCWKIGEATIYHPGNGKVLREKEENGEKRRQIMKWEQSHSLKNVTCDIEKGHFGKQYLLK